MTFASRFCSVALFYSSAGVFGARGERYHSITARAITCRVRFSQIRIVVGVKTASVIRVQDVASITVWCKDFGNDHMLYSKLSD